MKQNHNKVSVNLKIKIKENQKVITNIKHY